MEKRSVLLFTRKMPYALRRCLGEVGKARLHTWGCPRWISSGASKQGGVSKTYIYICCLSDIIVVFQNLFVAENEVQHGINIVVNILLHKIKLVSRESHRLLQRFK